MNNSLEWPAKESALLRKTAGLTYEKEIRLMIKNIQHEVTDLSRAEVLARQGRPHSADALLVKLNDDIELVEEYLLVAALMG